MAIYLESELAHEDIDLTEETADDVTVIQHFLDQSKADSLLIEWADGLRSIEETLRVARAYHNAQVLSMVQVGYTDALVAKAA